MDQVVVNGPPGVGGDGVVHCLQQKVDLRRDLMNLEWVRVPVWAYLFCLLAHVAA